MKQILAAMFLMLAICACGVAPVYNTVTLISPTQEPTTIPAAAPAPEMLTYQDEAAGFSFDYPKGWMLESSTIGDRASGVQLTSWTYPTGQIPAETPPGGSRLDVVVQLWEPKGNLQAFSEQRKSAWDASGMRIVSEEELRLSGGRTARHFVVQGADGAQGYFLFTTLGENYLVFSGNGDLALLSKIAQSLR
jgi:hypothetical protein